jgi:hypothetical protein
MTRNEQTYLLDLLEVFVTASLVYLVILISYWVDVNVPRMS